jgi:hypothetical protein
MHAIPSINLESTAFSRPMKYQKWSARAHPLRGGEAPTPLYLTRVKNAVSIKDYYNNLESQVAFSLERLVAPFPTAPSPSGCIQIALKKTRAAKLTGGLKIR